MVLYLAAAGIGTIGIVDHDRVDETNLQRQIVFDTRDRGRVKVEAVAERVQRLNPDVRLCAHAVPLGLGNAAEIISGYDVIADGCDNLETRLIVHDVAMALGKRHSSAARCRAWMVSSRPTNRISARRTLACAASYRISPGPIRCLHAPREAYSAALLE